MSLITLVCWVLIIWLVIQLVNSLPPIRIHGTFAPLVWLIVLIVVLFMLNRMGLHLR